VYALSWQDAEGDAGAGVFRRCGPLRHQPGDRIDLWVSRDGTWTTDEAPASLWLWLVGGMTLLGGALALLNQWRIRVWARATVRGEERRRRRAGA
jgi:hypothetical protein